MSQRSSLLTTLSMATPCCVALSRHSPAASARSWLRGPQLPPDELRKARPATGLERNWRPGRRGVAPEDRDFLMRQELMAVVRPIQRDASKSSIFKAFRAADSSVAPTIASALIDRIVHHATSSAAEATAQKSAARGGLGPLERQPHGFLWSGFWSASASSQFSPGCVVSD